MKKICLHCKNLEDHNHGGHGKCNKCYSKWYHSTHREQCKKKALNYYYTHKEERAIKAREWKQKNRDKVLKIKANYRKNNPLQCHAHNLANKQIKLTENDKCNNCGSKEKLEKHHPDYNYPCGIIILCYKCHLKLHNSSKITTKLKTERRNKHEIRSK